ncbi:MAG: acyl-CoA thioesterase [Glaciimonas sp.]|nr:acyl-CoA thioesterase [Glaciimonas sp.]
MHKKLVHTARIAIRWGDMDVMGHVNNTVYFRYLEQARIEWLTAIGCAPDPTAEGPVIVNAHCSFNKQLKYPGEIEILTYVGPPGRSSFETIQEIRRVDSADIIYAHGGAKVVWVNFPFEKSTPLPERVRQLLTATD